MYVFAIDATAVSCQVALFKADHCLAYACSDANRKRADTLMLMIDALFQKAELTPQQIHLLTATTGPGSFTGVRAGLAAIKGLQLSLNVPALGFTNFEVYSHQFEDTKGPILIALESLRNEFYVLGKNIPGLDPQTPQMLAIEEILPHLPPRFTLIGNGYKRFLTLVGDKHHIDTPQTEEKLCLMHLNKLAMKQHQTLAANSLPLPKPFYLNAPDTTKSN